MVFVYLITILVLSTWLARSIKEKRLIFSKTPYDPFFLVFLFIQIISTILSIHPRTSFFGYYSRFNGGLLSTVCYLILFYGFVSNLDKTQAKKAIATVISSSIVAALFAFPEHFGFAFSCLFVSGNIEATCWIQDVQTRIFGTFGQPNWLAAYLVTTIPLVWALIVHIIKKNQSQIKVLTYFAIQALLLSTLIFTKSRSALLGIAVAFGSFALLTFWNRTRKNTSKSKTTKAATALLALAVNITFVFAIFGSEFTPSIAEVIKNNFQTETNTSPQVGTVLDNGDLSIPVLNKSGTESGKIREIVWRGAVLVAQQYPLFGSGVETFAYSYYSFRPVAHNIVSEWDFIYNKAHNEFLNYAATTGILGLLSYCLIIVASLYQISKAIRSTSDPKSQAVLIGMFSGYLGLLVSNFFGFSTVSVSVLFFLYPAFSEVMGNNKEPVSDTTEATTSKQKIFYILNLLLTVYVLISLGRYYMADIYYARAETADSNQDYQQAIDNYETAIALQPKEAKYHNDFANSLSKASLAYAIDGDNVTMSKLAQQAFEEAALTLDLNNQHINYYKTQAGVFIRLSILDPSLLEVAETMLTEAISLAPTDAKLVYNLALVKTDLEKTDEAIQTFEKAVNLKANYEGARMELADLYEQQERYQEAIDQYQYILNYIAPQNSKAKENIESLQENLNS